MALKQLRKTNAASLAWVLLWLTCYVLFTYLFANSGIVLQHYFPDNISLFIQKLNGNNFRWFLINALYMLLWIGCGLYTNRIVIKHNVIQDAGYIPFLCYLSFSLPALLIPPINLKILIATFGVLVLIDTLYNTAKSQQIVLMYLNMGILISLVSLIYPPLFFLVVFLFYSQALFRHITIRELLYSLIGLSIPFIYLLSVQFLFDKPTTWLMQEVNNFFGIHQVVGLNLTQKIIIGGYALLVLLFSANALQLYAKIKIIRRRYMQSSLMLFVLLLLVFTVIPAVGTELVLVMAIPLSILFSNYFANCRVTWYNQFLYVIISLAMPMLWILNR